MTADVVSLRNWSVRTARGSNTANLQQESGFAFSYRLPKAVGDSMASRYETRIPFSSTRVTPMADLTREEIDAKLRTVEARTETRFMELSGKIDRVMDSIVSVGDRVTEEIGFVKTELNAVKSDNKWTRWTIIIALVTSLIAGIGALWVTQSNLLSAFQAGLSLHIESPSAPAKHP